MFIYSLPILFTYMQWGAPREFILVILFFLMVLFISTPYDAHFKEGEWGKESDLTINKYLVDAWVGLVKLWLVFWPFFIFLNIAFFITDNLAKKGSITVSSWDEIHFILLTPVIFWTIIVWRNSINTGIRFWAIAARFLTLTVFFEYILKLLIRRDFPRIFFECQEISLDYAACF